MPNIVHFEIPADDVGRARKFYTGLFGWKIEKFEGDMDYWMVQTGEKSAGGLEGGLMPRQMPNQAIINYIEVDSLNAYAAKVTDLGGTIQVPKTAVPGMGYFAVCLDTEGNAFGIWENDPEASVFSSPAEVIFAVATAVVAADERYTVDEMQTVWQTLENHPLFTDVNLKELEKKVFGLLRQTPPKLTPLSPADIGLVVSSAKKLLDRNQFKLAYELAVRLAYSDKTVEGYRLEIDSTEQALLDQFKDAFGITPDVVQKILDEVKKAL